MTLEEMRAKIEEFLSLGKHWRSEMAQWEPITRDEKGTDESRSPRAEMGLKVYLYTDRHSYCIVMYPARGERKSYLGCVMSNRAPWPGETHTRGGDLADGEFTDETLRRIFADILSKELHPVIARPAPKIVGA